MDSQPGDSPSRSMSPHSCELSHSMTRSASHDRLFVCEIIEYVLIHTEQPEGNDTL